MRRFLRLVVFLAFACVGTSESASGDVRSCATHAYSYAGFAAAQPASGVAASVSALASPQVLQGHVAAWVGVGGPGAGPDGSDEWLQAGLSSFAGGTGRLYYELALPDAQPRYVEVDSNVAPGEAHRLTVLEVRGRPAWWRVWIDGRPVTEPIYLPQSHNRWRPIATAESWNAGTGVCNSFAYRFRHVVAATATGRWQTFARGYRFQDPGYRVISDSRNTFRALGD